MPQAKRNTVFRGTQRARAAVKAAGNIGLIPVAVTASDFESATVGPSGGDDAIAINAAFAAGAPSVRIVGNLNIASTIRIPDGLSLYAESHLYIVKQFDGPMCVMGSWSETNGIFWEGNGAVYSGPGIVCEANSTRQIIGSRSRIMRCAGPCIDMSAYAAGNYSSIGGGDLMLIQRQDTTLPAIVLPIDEPGTTGVRRIKGISGGGGKLIDLNGSNVTMLQDCDTYRIDMGVKSRYAILLSNRFAIPAGEVLNIRGSNHRFGFNTTSQPTHFTADALGCLYESSNYDAGVVLDLNTVYNQIGHMILVPQPIDNSGNDLNRIEVTMPI